MRYRSARSFVALGALPLVFLAISAASAGNSTEKASYIVQMLDQPAVVYDGRISGLPATKPAKGKKIDPNSADVRKYVGYLNGKHDQALRKAGGGQKLYDYGFVFNGFAAVLTEAQAEKLKTMKDVVAVTPDTTDLVDTFTTPNFLGLAGPSGFWEATGAVGEDVIIGDLDTGFWPENPAYSDRTGTNPNGKSGKLGYHQIPGWHGKCTPGEAFNASMCNQKVIGAQAFSAGALAGGGIPDFEFLSPRDFDGHGSHTASTAGGNFDTDTDGDALAAGLTSINGIAPRARLSIYKVCWELPDLSNASCTSSDRVAAVDQAIADGVDVLNHSIGATRTNFLDPVMVAFFNAAASGVFVAASAGNSGPTVSTVAAPGPWLTTVAASSHNRAGAGSVTLGNGVTLNGSSFNATSTGPFPFIDSVNAGLAGANATNVRLCFAAVDNGGVPVLDSAKVAGKIVLCDRGVNARINKSLAVQEAGGVGMVLVNTTPIGTNADLHFVPTVHLESTERAAAKAHAATVGPTATVNVATINFGAPAPAIAAFSSRGPSNAAGGDILKPDVSAPGVDILASVAPPGTADRNFDLMSGTSMSSPHVAGAAALLKDLHPDWSPMMIKSALMTTGSDLISGANVFHQGAGHIDLTKAGNPGLVYDSGSADWIRFICGTGQLTGSLCTTFGTIDPSDLNQASIAIGDLAGAQTITRTVKNVGSASETYTAAVSGLTGLTVVVNPSTFTIAPGASQTYTVAFTRTTAALAAYTTGFLTWNGSGGHKVRSPVAIRPVAVAAPAEVTFNTATGPVSWQVKTGFAGTLGTAVRGLVAATTTPYTVAQDPDQNFDQADPTGTFSKSSVTIPAGSRLYRVGIYEDAITPAGTDLDLFVFQGTTLVGVSADGDSNEEVTFTFAEPSGNANPITLTVYVHGFDTQGPSASGTLFEWVLGATSAGNTTIAILPNATATIGGSKTIQATFSGLAPATRYLGTVRYDDGAVVRAQTILRVNTP
ncbi:MAG: S8 family peptidase [Gammaproteobacteria bacterium]